MSAVLAWLGRELNVLFRAMGALNTDHGLHGHRELEPPA